MLDLFNRKPILGKFNSLLSSFLSLLKTLKNLNVDMLDPFKDV